MDSFFCKINSCPVHIPELKCTSSLSVFRPAILLPVYKNTLPRSRRGSPEEVLKELATNPQNHDSETAHAFFRVRPVPLRPRAAAPAARRRAGVAAAEVLRRAARTRPKLRLRHHEG